MSETEKTDYQKDGLCTAKNHSDCLNFQPIHDLELCVYTGLGYVCRFEEKK